MNINVVKEFPKGKRCIALWIYKDELWSNIINSEGEVINEHADCVEHRWSGEFKEEVEFIGYIILED